LSRFVTSRFILFLTMYGCFLTSAQLRLQPRYQD